MKKDTKAKHSDGAEGSLEKTEQQRIKEFLEKKDVMNDFWEIDDILDEASYQAFD